MPFEVYALRRMSELRSIISAGTALDLFFACRELAGLAARLSKVAS